MDGSNLIGGVSWNAGMMPLRASSAQAPSTPQNAAPVAHDRVDIQALPHAEPLHEAPAPPAAAPAPALAEVAASTPAPAQATSSLGGGVFFGPVGNLGVLAQLDEPSAVEAVRAVDNHSRNEAFADLGLIGPGNASLYLADPKGLYIGM